MKARNSVKGNGEFKFSCNFHYQKVMLTQIATPSRECHTPNTFGGLVGKVQKNYLLKEEGRESGEKSAHSMPTRAGARARDLPRARRGFPSYTPGGCLDK